MNIKQYILIFAAGTALMFSAWFLILITIDPTTTGTITLIIFYLTLVLSLLGFLTTILTWVRTKGSKKSSPEEIVLTSLRQGVMLSTLFTVSLILLHNEMFSLLSIFLLIFLFGLLEFFFLKLAQKSKK